MTGKHHYLPPTINFLPFSEEDILRTSPELGGNDDEGGWGPLIPAV